jgi:hypothetical protein
MPKAYLVAHIRVHDENGYEEFKKRRDRLSPTTVVASSSETRMPITARGACAARSS